MLFARMIDLTVVYSIARFRYGFYLSGRALRSFVFALFAGLAVIFSAFYAVRFPWLRFAGFAIAAVSVVVSLRRLSQHGNLMKSLFKRIFRKNK